MDDLVLPPFRVSKAAIDKIEAVGGTVRFTIEDGGCCGLSYSFHSSSGEPDDERFGCPGAELFLPQSVLSVLTGARLDYSDRIKPPRFRVLRNPNTPDRCPCGRYFGGEWPGRGQPGCRAYAPMPWDDGDD